ncbi:MAG: hypothetical protein GWP08_13850 [Nitrospiraceae bacterium]|nr:hypothetical protein [Nitrospiraceae bacterium]
MASAISDIVGRLEETCRDPLATARALARDGRKVAAHMCTYTPEELVLAAGYVPIRILGWSAETHRADGLIQAYACSLARSALDLALSGQLDFAELMLFPHTCDTIQNLTDIWQRNVPSMKTIAVSTPVSTGGEAEVVFYRAELERVRGILGKLDAPVTDEALKACLALYAAHRAAMRRLYGIRRANPCALSARGMMSIVLSSFLMPKDDHLAVVEELIAALEAAEIPENGSRPRLFVAGAACSSEAYVAAVEEAGAWIADDNLCTGARAFALQETGCGDPIEELARTYLSRVPCPAKHRPGFDPGAALLEDAQRAKADGVVFLFTKFCDPWAFDYPRMRDALEAAGIPSLLIEIEQHVPPSAQFETRVAAFVEMIDTKEESE